MFKNMSIGTKLLASFVLIALIAGMIGLVGITRINQVSQANVKTYNQVTQPLEILADVISSLQRIRLNLWNIINSKDQKQIEASLKLIQPLQQDIDKRWIELEKSLADKNEKESFEAFKKSIKEFNGSVSQITDHLLSGKNEEAIEVMHGDARDSAQDSLEAVDKLMTIKKKAAKTTSAESILISKKSSLIMIILIVCSVVSAVLLGIYSTNKIRKPLNTAVSIADRIAQGDMSVAITVSSNDEIGKLLGAIANMVSGLKDMIERTTSVANNLAVASDGLNSISDKIAHGTDEVATKATTVATASEEMSTTSMEIALSCAMAAESSQQSTDAANNGAAVVNETISGMEMIARRVKDSSKTIEALGARSEQIGKIVGTIEDIADQTNLLALNAAIEAARAGEQGRGFAVVADEVRALAERTTRATREIADMIKTIQKETRDAVVFMEEGVVEVEHGTASSHKSGQAIREIMDRISEVSSQICQIATAADKQSATTAEVTSMVQQINEIVHNTSKIAEDTSTSASQLAEQSKEMQGMMARFKL